MKNSILFIALALSVVFINAQNYLEFTASETISPDYNILQSNDTIVQFTVTIPGMFEAPVDTFNRVNIEEHTRLDSIGFPEIPIVSFLVAIPDCDSINLEIYPLDSSQFTGFNIYPAPELVQDTTTEGYAYLREEFVYDQTAYSNDNWFPGLLGNEVDHGAIRSQSVIRILIYPVQFNPVKKTIKAYSEYNISITFNNATGPINENVGIFNEMLGNTLINYESNGLNASVSCGAGSTTLNCEDYFVSSLPNQKVDDPCDYLIIAPAEFFENSWLCDLADHRTSYNGFDVKIVTTDIIGDQMPQGFDLNIQIRMLISNTYFSENANNTYDGKLAYINLVGDVLMESTQIGIPTFYDPVNPEYGGYDVVYTQLTIPPNSNSPDIYPDLMIGRCSVDDATQLQNVVTKIIGFTPNLYTYNDKILNFLGDSDGYYDYQSEIIEEMEYTISFIYDNELIYPTEYNGYLPGTWVLKSYNNCQSVDVISSYSNGQMFFNYMGHGSSTSICGFSYDDVYSTPAGLFPFFISGACITGKFQSIINEDCFGERFLCYEPNRGAIGFIGASESVGGNTFHIISNYYKSTIYNYSFMLGEALMETKLQYTNNNDDYINSYNLLGDPALNIFYENSAPLPDLFIKDYHITFAPFPTNHGETISINGYIRNNTNMPVNDPFTVNCYAVNTSTQEIIQIGEEIVNGLTGNYANVSFIWNTSGFALNENDFDIYIEIDIYDEVTEIIETNNSNSNNLNLYLYASGFPVPVEKADNSDPIAFDFYPEYNGNEIIFGEDVFSYNGNEILNGGNNSTNGNTSVGNLNNNDKFQYVTIKTDPFPVEIKAFEPPSSNPVWSYPALANSTDWVGPVISDLDHDGFEEVIALEILPDGTKLICLNQDGTLRWNYELTIEIEFTEYFLVCNLNNPFNHIVIIDSQGTIYFLKENIANNGLVIDNTFVFPYCSIYEKKFMASDIDKNGIIDIVVTYRKSSSTEQKLGILNSLNMSFIDVTVTNTGGLSDPITTDLNNDGLSEIAIASIELENLYIYDNNLILLNTIHISNLSLSEIICGDFDGDNNNDLVVMTNNNETDYFLNIYNLTGNQIIQTPIIDKLSSVLISDINHDNDNEIIYYYGRDLYVIDIPEAGSGIGWPGYRGNFRNTGVYEQPAYFGENGETVYWMNTIVLSAEVDNIIPEGSTVIIKPGTKIKAHTNCSLIVNGTLIAEGTEKFPITFTADINGTNEGYWQGIILSNNSSSSFEYVEIYNAEFGLLFEDFSDQTTENCTFTNNIVGIGAFNSSPVIKECYFTGNDKAIGSYSNGSPILTDLVAHTHFKNAIINNDIGIYINNASLYINAGYNDIYNDPASGYYLDKTSDRDIKAEYNYWGSTNINEIKKHISPSRSFDIEPVCSSANTTYKSTTSSEDDLLRDAYSEIAAGNYSDAEIIFKDIIANYPSTNAGYISVSGLYTCYCYSGSNWQNLETYYTNIYNDTTENIDKKLVFGYLNLSKRALGKYSEAIANYESILLNNPTYNDSVFAVINIGNTYLEAGLYKSSLGTLTYLRPKSDAAHIENTIDLLLTLKDESYKQNHQYENKFFISEIYPNPFKDETTIVYHIPLNCTITIKVYDAMGKIIQSEKIGRKMKGKQHHILDMSAAKPGVYHIVLEANGKSESFKKIVVN